MASRLRRACYRSSVEVAHRVVGLIMSTGTRPRPAVAPQSEHAEERRAALGYLAEAWAEARLDGIDGDCLAQACLFTALAELVSTYGEEAAARYTEGLATRIRNGEFSVSRLHQ
jgi:hypothetical protein